MLNYQAYLINLFEYIILKSNSILLIINSWKTTWRIIYFTNHFVYWFLWIILNKIEENNIYLLWYLIIFIVSFWAFLGFHRTYRVVVSFKQEIIVINFLISISFWLLQQGVFQSFSFLFYISHFLLLANCILLLTLYFDSKLCWCYPL